MKNSVIILCTFLLFFFSSAMAQSVSPISPGSDLQCIYLPNGKTQIGRLGANGKVKKTGFDSAQDKEKKKEKDLRKANLKLRDIIREFEKKDFFANVRDILNPKRLEPLKKFIFDGNELPQTLSKDELIAAANAKIESNNALIDYQKTLISLILKCKKKQLPTPGNFQVIFGAVKESEYKPTGDTAGAGYVGVFAVVPIAYVDARQHYFCFERPANQSGGNISEFALTNPCYQKTLSNIPGACDHLLTTDGNGKLTTAVALLAKINFFYKDRPGALSYAEEVGKAEAKLRNDPNIGGWSDSVQFAVNKGSADACNKVLFK